MNRDEFTNGMSGRLTSTLSGALAFVPNPLPPKISWTTSLVTELIEAHRSLARLAELASSGVGESIQHGITRMFSNLEAQSSSEIEGIETTVSELVRFQNDPRYSRPNENTREVHNYQRALEFGIAQLIDPHGLPPGKRMMLALHEILLSGAVRGRDKSPGEFRRVQNFIGMPGDTEASARYVPPPVQAMHACFNDLESFIHSTELPDPLIRIASIHYQFESIHPFKDGNGRVGRLWWIQVPSATRGLMPYST